MSTAIIVLHYGSVEDTLRCLKSLEGLTNADDIVVYVVDNGTDKLNKNMLRELSIKYKFIKNKENLGYAGGNNVGIRQALKDNNRYILLLNNDATVDPKLLTELQGVIEKENVGIAGCVITYTGSKKIWFAGGILNRTLCLTMHKRMNQLFQPGKAPKTSSVDFITGAALLTKREVFKKVGLLPENYFLYWEDVDFCFKAAGKGYKCVLLNKPLVKHSVSAASGKRGSNALSPMRAYYYSRNPFIFMKENHLPLTTGILGQLLIHLPYSMLMLSSFDSFKAYLKGLAEGLAYILMPVNKQQSGKSQTRIITE